MELYFNGSKVYELMAPTSALDLCISKGHLWQHAMASWVLDLYSDNRKGFLCTLMVSFCKHLIPKFNLLVTTQKSIMISTFGGFVSRPFVGMLRWATTLCSVLIGVDGLILLKINRARHSLSALMVDSCDLLGRLR